MRCGVTLNPATPLETIEPVLDLVDMVLIMSVQPGLGGQKYIPSSTDKIRRLKAMLDARGSKADIQVDGGVSAANLREVLDAGSQYHRGRFCCVRRGYRRQDPGTDVCAG